MDCPSRRSRYEERLDRSRQLLATGAIHEAVAAYEEAAALARRLGDRGLVLLAGASAEALAVELDPSPTRAARLREIFTESRDARTRHVAGLALSRHYHARGENGKALFYARTTHRAGDRADRWSSSQQVGILCLACSHPREAMGWLQEALSGWRGDRAPFALNTSTLAYAATLVESPQARAYLATTESLLREEQRRWPFYLPSVHINMGFAYLERRRPDEAQMHAQAALRALDALPQGSACEHRAALYLAGEAAAELGDATAAAGHFDTLLATYYPASRRFREWLVWVRTSAMFNWLA